MVYRARFASLLALMLFSAPSFAALASAEYCAVDLLILNKSRRVTGDVDVECYRRIRFLTFHSPPFGNWGVELGFHPGSRRDGFQFSGWKADDGWLQWNSCTSHAEFPSGDERYYNDDGFRAQKAWPDIVNVSHSVAAYDRGEDGEACDSLSGLGRVVVDNATIDVYEMDPGIGDERVATLSYGRVEISYDCDGAWACLGESEWIEPVSGYERVYAELKVVAVLRKEE